MVSERCRRLRFRPGFFVCSTPKTIFIPLAICAVRAPMLERTGSLTAPGTIAPDCRRISKFIIAVLQSDLTQHPMPRWRTRTSVYTPRCSCLRSTENRRKRSLPPGHLALAVGEFFFRNVSKNSTPGALDRSVNSTDRTRRLVPTNSVGDAVHNALHFSKPTWFELDRGRIKGRIDVFYGFHRVRTTG